MRWEVEDWEDSESIISDQYDTEYVEHDEALGVFKSPRPSYTLSEAAQVDLRERLAEEENLTSIEASPFETAIPLGSARDLQRPISGPQDENPWASTQQTPNTEHDDDAVMVGKPEEKPAIEVD